MAFERSDERGLLPHTKAPAPSTSRMCELEPASMMLSPAGRLPRLVDGAAETVHRQRVLGAHVNDASVAPITYPPMIMPSSRACGSLSISLRFM